MGSIIVMILAAGCSQSKPDPVNLTAETPAQLTSTIAPTPLVTSDPTPTSLPALTPTLVPILPVEKAQTKLLDMLSNNTGCRLPCLWGITPGESTYQDAQAILMPLSGISEPLAGFLPQGGAIFPVITEDNFKFSLTVGFNVDSSNESKIVNRIGFNSQGFIAGEPDNPSVLKPIFDSRPFGVRLRPYMLSGVLSENGMPTMVLISTDGGPDRGKHIPGFVIALFYPDQGIMVAYTTNRQLVDGSVRGCPANAHVEIELSPTGQPDSFEKRLAQTKWGNLWPPPADSPNWKSVEEATPMSLEEFYETFRQPTDQCIDTPADLWPVPES